MSFSKQTVRDIDLQGKTVLMRADYNVPVDHGRITDDYRIKQSLPTLQYLLERHCTVVITSHLGRPDGKPMKEYSLAPVATRLSELIGKKVTFVEDCIGPAARAAVKAAQPGDLLLLENVRFHPEEEANDEQFAKALVEASGADVFVQDCFGAVHRAHASIDAATHFLPSVAGLLLEREVDIITNVIEKPERPLMAIIGGAKISDKIDIITRFIDIADFVAIGGAMGNTFLLAEGIKIGKSKAEANEVPLAKDIIEKARAKAKQQQFIFYIPQDGVVATSTDSTVRTRIVDWDAHVIAAIEHYPKRPPRQTAEVADDELILDIGPFSGAFIAGGMQLARTVIWNGAMGVTEITGKQGPIGPFSHGTDTIVDAMLGEFGHKPFTVVGGGDTVGYIEDNNLLKSFSHVSTGGGASLELMAGKPLPGVEALQDKKPKE